MFIILARLFDEIRTFFERNWWYVSYAKLNVRAGKKEGGWEGKEFLPAIALRHRQISYFALRNVSPRIWQKVSGGGIINRSLKKPLNNTCISTSKNDTIEVEKNY